MSEALASRRGVTAGETENHGGLADTADVAATLAAWRAVSHPFEVAQHDIESTLGDRHSLCLTACEVMQCLSARQGGTPLSVVCETVERSQPRISRLVTQMEERGLVKRSKSPDDKRAFQISLTAEGRLTFGEASDTLAECLRQISERRNVAGEAFSERLDKRGRRRDS